jgi:hypothetical protein
MRAIGGITKVATLISSIVLIGTLCGVQLAAGTESNTIASYDGGTIDLSLGWGTATICVVMTTGISCYADQSDYQEWANSQVKVGGGPFSPLSGNCSTGLKLFQDRSYGGNELILYELSNWINLSSYSFSDEVSSYKVGACSVSMTDAQNGSGNVYPGPTAAGSDVSWIGSAWVDRVESVYIY